MAAAAGPDVSGRGGSSGSPTSSCWSSSSSTGAKPYYLAGLFPVLLAAGAEPVLAWARGRRRGPALVGGALAASLVVAGVLFLPAVPEQALADTPVVAVNYDAGETVAWPRFARVVAGVHAEVVAGQGQGRRPPSWPRTTASSGRSRATRPDVRGLQRAQRALVGGSAAGVGAHRRGGRVREGDAARVVRLRAPVGRFDNGLDLDNDEQGARFFLCTRRLGTWSEIWPQVRRLG